MRIKYKLVRNNSFKKYIVIKISNSYNVNKKLDKESIGIIKFYDNDLISRVIKKKMDIKFKYIFELMIKTEEDDSDPSEGLMMCLNELDKLSKEFVNKYRIFLDKKRQVLTEKKIMILEQEIKMKLFNMQVIKSPINIDNGGFEEKEEKESTRRR